MGKGTGEAAIPLFFAVVSVILGAVLFVSGFFVSNGALIVGIGGIGFLTGLLLVLIARPRR